MLVALKASAEMRVAVASGVERNVGVPRRRRCDESSATRERRARHAAARAADGSDAGDRGRVKVAPGAVTEGDTLVVLEAMKMELPIGASRRRREGRALRQGRPRSARRQPA